MPTEELTPLLVVKSKEGELDALLHTSEFDGRVQVMIELLDGVPPAGRVARKIVKFCVEAALAGMPTWIDTTWLSEVNHLAGSRWAAFERFEHDIEDIVKDMLAGVGGPFLIPVVPLDVGNQQLERLQTLLEHEERQVAIRIRRTSSETTELVRSIERVATVLRCGADNLHLVFDEGYVPTFGEHRVRTIVELVTALDQRFRVASFTMLAGSVPSKRTSYETHTRERTEVLLWRAVQHACGRPVRYGDYGVVHPGPPAMRERPATPNPYIHYTVPNATLSIARRIPERRGSAVPSGASEQYFLEVASELVQRPEFAGANFSWGDRHLYSCRTTPTMRMGNSTKWISLATSHHVVHLARRMDAPSP